MSSCELRDIYHPLPIGQCLVSLWPRRADSCVATAAHCVLSSRTTNPAAATEFGPAPRIAKILLQLLDSHCCGFWSFCFHFCQPAWSKTESFSSKPKTIATLAFFVSSSNNKAQIKKRRRLEFWKASSCLAGIQFTRLRLTEHVRGMRLEGGGGSQCKFVSQTAECCWMHIWERLPHFPSPV